MSDDSIYHPTPITPITPEWREAIQGAQQNRVETQTVLREQKKDEMRNEAKRRGSRR